jgi:hypothetical protein
MPHGKTVPALNRALTVRRRSITPSSSMLTHELWRESKSQLSDNTAFVGDNSRQRGYNGVVLWLPTQEWKLCVVLRDQCTSWSRPREFNGHK